jgi:hypothetical protein
VPLGEGLWVRVWVPVAELVAVGVAEGVALLEGDQSGVLVAE